MTTKLMLSKLTHIEEEVINARIKLGAIEEHLKTLNGSVARHEQAIRDNCNNISAITNWQYKVIGGLGAVFVLAQLGLILLK